MKIYSAFAEKKMIQEKRSASQVKYSSESLMRWSISEQHLFYFPMPSVRTFTADRIKFSGFVRIGLSAVSPYFCSFELSCFVLQSGDCLFRYICLSLLPIFGTLLRRCWNLLLWGWLWGLWKFVHMYNHWNRFIVAKHLRR